METIKMVGTWHLDKTYTAAPRFIQTVELVRDMNVRNSMDKRQNDRWKIPRDLKIWINTSPLRVELKYLYSDR